jgi:S-methylmethionine-dependent homocysteine/selenocysteine methylase
MKKFKLAMGSKTLFTEPYYLTDGGIETTLIFQKGIALNHFAAFELLKDYLGQQALRSCYIPYLEVAATHKLPLIIETPTWRANPDWGEKLGYAAEELFLLNMRGVQFIKTLSEAYKGKIGPMLISGNIGPRGDGYIAGERMIVEEAKTYHMEQVQAFVTAGADLVTAMTINYRAEAIGIILAAKANRIPVVISFTVETDGRLPDGEALHEVIAQADRATGAYATHYMINCAHPEHFLHILSEKGEWKQRIKGIRANASNKSHAELDEMEILDAGDKAELAKGYLQLRSLLPELRVIGGCCGTDHTHMETICEAFFPESIKNLENQTIS